MKCKTLCLDAIIFMTRSIFYRLLVRVGGGGPVYGPFLTITSVGMCMGYMKNHQSENQMETVYNKTSQIMNQTGIKILRK